MEKFNELKYERPDFKKIKEENDKFIKRIKEAKSYDEFKQVLKEAKDFECEYYTMGTISHVRNTCNVNDKFYEDEVKYINVESANLLPQALEFISAIVTSPFKNDYVKEYGEEVVRGSEASLRIISEKIIENSIKEGDLTQQYSKTSATCVTDFRGESCNFYGLLKHMESVDRNERKEAFEAWANLYESVSPKLDEIYDKLIDVRVDMANKLNLKDYVEYTYISNGHLDYTPKEIANFRELVKKYVTPEVDKLYKEQAKRIGVDKIKFYDEKLIFPEGNANPIGNKDELVAKANKMYHKISNETGEFFDFMVKYDLFDLETRNGKRPGGYCTFMPKYKAPFIFSNFNGTSADVDVLTHEAGHAFQAYLGSRTLPLIDLVHSTSDICEIHSMSMEHFAYPYMDDFFGENANKYRFAHLFGALETIPYLVSVDEFQHKVFANPTMSAKERRKVWKDIENAYMPWRDYDGNKFLEEGGFWMQKQHIFLYPFYYVDYALAQVCAFQFFIRNENDHEAAWNDYLNLCKAGGSKNYFELLKVANLANPFEEETIKNVVANVVEKIKEFKEKI